MLHGRKQCRGLGEGQGFRDRNRELSRRLEIDNRLTTRSCVVMSLGAKAPELFMGTVPTTASPGLRPTTFMPTASMVPAKSVPIARGNLEPVTIFMSPLRSFQSSGLIEAAATRTTTSFACGSGSVKAARCTNSGPP